MKKIILGLMIFLVTSLFAENCTKKYIQPTNKISEFIKKTIGFDVIQNFNKSISKFHLKYNKNGNFLMSEIYTNGEYYPSKTGVFYYQKGYYNTITYIKALNMKYYEQDILNAIKEQTPTLYNHSKNKYFKIKNHYIEISFTIINSIDNYKYPNANKGNSFILYWFTLQDNEIHECIKKHQRKEYIHNQGKKLHL